MYARVAVGSTWGISFLTALILLESCAWRLYAVRRITLLARSIYGGEKYDKQGIFGG